MLVTYPTRSPFAARRSFDRAFDRAFAQLATLSAPRPVPSFGPTIAGSWTDDAYEFTVDLPGVPAENVAVSVTGRTVTLNVITDVTTDVATGSSSWTRSVRLPQTLDPEQVSARYVDGRLTVTVGRTAQPPAPEARRIALDTTPVQPALEAATTEPAATPEPAQAAENGEGTSVTG